MARRKPEQQPTGKDANGLGDKRGGYSGAEDAASVPPPERVPSAYLPVARKSR
jgi:hypothetical protein